MKIKEGEIKELQSKRKSLDIMIADRDILGPFKNTRCGICHMRGRNADGNRGKKPAVFHPVPVGETVDKKKNILNTKRNTNRWKKKANHVKKRLM